MDTDQQQELLLEVGAYVQTHVVKLTNEPQQLWPPTSPPKAKPSKDFIEEFYAFLIESFGPEIENGYLRKMQRYNDEIFGLTKKQQRKVALKLFKMWFEEARNHTVAIVFAEKEKGLETVKNLGMLETLSWQQMALQQELAGSELKDAFLIGNSNFYNSSVIYIPLITEMIDLETNLKCLLALNQQFSFEGYGSPGIPKPFREEKKGKPKKESEKAAKITVDLSDTIEETKRTNTVFNIEDAFNYLLEHVF